jgi:dTDP-glucose 4,6-dehydratase
MYGDGGQIRDWLHVLDHCRALDVAAERGVSGEVYNVGGGNEVPNRELARRILDTLGKPDTLVTTVTDRPGHDRRYALDCGKLKALGWAPEMPFERGMTETIEWYRDNQWWWEPIKHHDTYKAYYQTQYVKR